MTDVCVVGLGKIGLPLACAIARAGHRVRGADISPTVVGQVNAGDEPFPGEAGLAAALRDVVGSGALTATTDTASAVAESTVVVIVVPLVVDEDAKPDFRAMDSATAAVGDAIGPGTLVSYETTLPVGTTRTRFANALAERSGLRVGQDLFVAHSPERVFSGRIFEDLRRYPKLVGGVDGASAGRAVEFYGSFLEFDERPDLQRPNGVWDLGTAEAAELAKLAETTYRDLNIAYANELAVAAEGLGVDIYAVIESCNSQPFSHIHQPGISVGGHCIPVYPHFLLDSVEGSDLPRRARSINSSMPKHVVDAVRRRHGDLTGTRVLVVGLSYRPGVKEDAFSGTYPLVEELEAAGASVVVWDPLYTRGEIEAQGLAPGEPGEAAEVVIVHTAHPEAITLGVDDVPGVKLVFDGRAVVDPRRWHGISVLRLGVGEHGNTANG